MQGRKQTRSWVISPPLIHVLGENSAGTLPSEGITYWVQLIDVGPKAVTKVMSKLQAEEKMMSTLNDIIPRTERCS